MSLLPSHHDQFRSKEYWDRFFLERGGEQFEWYGTYIEMQVCYNKVHRNGDDNCDFSHRPMKSIVIFQVDSDISVDFKCIMNGRANHRLL